MFLIKLFGMNKLRDWYWQIKALGQGPNLNFLADFDPSDAEQLIKIVGDNWFPDFTCRTEQTEQYKVWKTCEKYLLLAQDSQWFGTYIEVCDSNFSIQRILGGGTNNPESESRLLLQLAQTSNLTLKDWRINYTDYTFGHVAGGYDATSLVEYLHTEGDLAKLPSCKPDFDAVERELKGYLTDFGDMARHFQLIDFRAAEWSCQAIVQQLNLPEGVHRWADSCYANHISGHCRIPPKFVRSSPFLKEYADIKASCLQLGYSYLTAYDHPNEFE